MLNFSQEVDTFSNIESTVKLNIEVTSDELSVGNLEIFDEKDSMPFSVRQQETKNDTNYNQVELNEL